MTQELNEKITAWVKINLNTYYDECDGTSEVITYMTEDAIGEFGSFDNEDLAEDIAALIRKLVRGS